MEKLLWEIKGLEYIYSFVKAAFGAVLILIYLLVVSWFRSFVTPLIIMAPIPLTLVGILPGH